jgi:predicted nucleic acid-binding protein
MPGRVADASVIAAIIFEEPRADEANALASGADLYAPTILAYELGSVARKKAIADPGGVDAIAAALEAGLAWHIRWTDVQHVAVLRLALQTGLSTYDASYLYLARVLDVPLITFDEGLRAAADATGV